MGFDKIIQIHTLKNNLLYKKRKSVKVLDHFDNKNSALFSHEWSLMMMISPPILYISFKDLLKSLSMNMLLNNVPQVLLNLPGACTKLTSAAIFQHVLFTSSEAFKLQWKGQGSSVEKNLITYCFQLGLVYTQKSYHFNYASIVTAEQPP